MISVRFIIMLAAAFVIGTWLARTEMGAHVRSTPPHQTLYSVLNSFASLAEGRMSQSPPKTEFAEPIAEFRPDEPLRRLAAAVGMLVIESHDERGVYVSDCTAVVIAPEAIITNFHCVPGTRQGEIIDRVTLWLDYVDARNVTKVSIALRPLEQNETLDYAILKPEHPINSATHALSVMQLRQALPGERLILIHHSRGAPQQVTRLKCRIATDHDLSVQRLAHTCWTAQGASGALIFSERDHAILGLHHSRAKKLDTLVGYGTPAVALLARSPILQRLSHQTPR